MSSPFRPIMLPTLSTGTTSRNTLSPGHPGHLFAAAAASSIAAASASSATSGGNEASAPTSAAVTAAADGSALTVGVRWLGAWVWVAGCGAGEGVASREPRQVEGTGLLEEKGSTRSAPAGGLAIWFLTGSTRAHG